MERKGKGNVQRLDKNGKMNAAVVASSVAAVVALAERPQSWRHSRGLSKKTVAA